MGGRRELVLAVFLASFLLGTVRGKPGNHGNGQYGQSWDDLKRHLSGLLQDTFNPQFNILNEKISDVQEQLKDLNLEELVQKENKVRIEEALANTDGYVLDEKWMADNKLQVLITGTGEKPALPDSALTASGSYSGRHQPRCSRMGVYKPDGCYSAAWSRARSDDNPWIQVDLGKSHDIYAIVTQGRGGERYQQWVTAYNLMYTMHDDGHWNNYADRKLAFVPKEFVGNKDRHTPKAHVLDPVISARFVRLHPTSYIGWCSLRWELVGRPSTEEHANETLDDKSALLSSEQDNLELSNVQDDDENSWKLK